VHAPLRCALTLSAAAPYIIPAMPDDPLRRVYEHGGELHIQAGGRTYSTKSNGGEPNTWKVTPFAEMGTGEPFIDCFSGEFLDLLGAANIKPEKEEAAKNAIMDILMEGLMPAFADLRKIRESATTPMPEMDRRKLYEDFAKRLWHAYKDLFPKACELIGFDIGFLFRPEKEFEKGVEKFLAKFPSLVMDIPAVFRSQRANWQNGLANYRNDFLEHRKQDREAFEAYYQPETAEMLFEHCWRTMADVIPVFIEARLYPGWSIMEIPEAERDPKNYRRFRYFQCDPVDRGTFE
jgi:hypothetical protein